MGGNRLLVLRLLAFVVALGVLLEILVAGGGGGEIAGSHCPALCCHVDVLPVIALRHAAQVSVGTLQGGRWALSTCRTGSRAAVAHHRVDRRSPIELTATACTTCPAGQHRLLHFGQLLHLLDEVGLSLCRLLGQLRHALEVLHEVGTRAGSGFGCRPELG